MAATSNLVDLQALQLKLYIGGQFVEAPLTLPVVDPATEEVIVNAPAGKYTREDGMRRGGGVWHGVRMSTTDTFKLAHGGVGPV